MKNVNSNNIITEYVSEIYDNNNSTYIETTQEIKVCQFHPNFVSIRLPISKVVGERKRTNSAIF